MKLLPELRIMFTPSHRFVVALITLIVAALARAAEPPPYNLISIVTDDQAVWSIGAYGARQARTPNMDRLAREGARFLNAFTCTPVCSPSRASFLTGRFGTQLGITDCITPKEANNGVGLAPDSMTWPKLLRQRGYVTGLVGKWHLGVKPEFHPARLGFDHFTGALAGSFKPQNPEFEVGGKLTQMRGFGADLVTDDALSFLQTNRSSPVPDARPGHPGLSEPADQPGEELDPRLLRGDTFGGPQPRPPAGAAGRAGPGRAHHPHVHQRSRLHDRSSWPPFQGQRQLGRRRCHRPQAAEHVRGIDSHSA